MQMALIEIEPISITSVVYSSMSSMGTYCLIWFHAMRKRDSKITSFVSTPKALSESRHWPNCARASYMRCSRDNNSRRRVLRISNWSRTYRGLSWPTVAASVMLTACIVVDNIFFYIGRPTVTFHQGQGHRIEHEHYMSCICLPSCEVWML